MAIDLQKYRVDFSGLAAIDQSAEAIEWSLDQFKDKPVYLKVLKAFSDEIAELYQAAVGLARARTIADGVGVYLDGLGRIVGQKRETTPADLPDSFFYWDDDLSGGESIAVSGDTSAHFMDSHTQFVTGATVNAAAAPTDNDFRDQIIRRVYQNNNKHSSVTEIQAAVKDVLGIDILIEQTGKRTIKLYVPTGTPSWVKYYLTAKSFTAEEKGYNRWYFPFPAGIIIDSTIGEY